jgi:hypothetical protein
VPYFLVQIPDNAVVPRQNGADTQVVYALSAADAQAIAAATYPAAAGAWAGATVTELEPPTDMAGVTLGIVVNNLQYSYTGVANDTLALLAAGLAAKMALDTTTFPSGVTSSGNVLTIASGNNLGAATITATLTVGGKPYAVAMATLAINGTGAPGTARTLTLGGGTLAGTRLRITVADPSTPIDMSIYFNDGESIDTAAARLVALLNTSSIVTHATYTAGSNTITIPGATDAQGAKVITCTMTKDDQPVTTAPVVNAAGLSSIDRTIVLTADASLPVPFPPKSFGLFQKRP